MKIEVNGNRLFVDIEGAGLVPDGPDMREKPTLLLLHGGPGADHSIYKPAYGCLSDICQIVYYDHLGNGRSDVGDPGDWTLDRWGDDVKGLCDALGIERPIVLGASFGGFVAQNYATRYPDHARGLILSVTAAKVDFEVIYHAFGKIGGPAAEDIARRYWSDPTAETRTEFAEHCVPLYAHRGLDPHFFSRIVDRAAVGLHFNGPRNEQGRFDFRDALARITSPTLVLSGACDPITPPVFQDEIASGVPGAELCRFDAAGHLLESDVPEAYFTRLRHFITSLS